MLSINQVLCNKIAQNFNTNISDAKFITHEYRRLSIMGGVPPTPAEFSALSSLEKYQLADVGTTANNLLAYQEPNLFLSNSEPYGAIVYADTIAYDRQDVIRTGIATWSLFISTDSFDATSYSEKGVSVISNLGLQGSGADQELSSLNLVAGVGFTLSKISFKFYKEY